MADPKNTLLLLGTKVQSPGVWATFSVLLTSWFDWPLRKTQRQTALCGGSQSFSLAIRPFLAQIKTQLPQGAWEKSPKVIALCGCVKFPHQSLCIYKSKHAYSGRGKLKDLLHLFVEINGSEMLQQTRTSSGKGRAVYLRRPPVWWWMRREWVLHTLFALLQSNLQPLAVASGSSLQSQMGLLDTKKCYFSCSQHRLPSSRGTLYVLWGRVL